MQECRVCLPYSIQSNWLRILFGYLHFTQPYMGRVKKLSVQSTRLPPASQARQERPFLPYLLRKAHDSFLHTGSQAERWYTQPNITILHLRSLVGGISTQSITQAACPRLPGLNPKRPSHHRVSRGRCLELEFSGKNQENGDAAVGGIRNGDSDGKHEAGSI